jgi:uncharacterized FlaG/YvyC family protein
MRIFGNLVAKNERLPKETGLGAPPVQMQKSVPLVRPELFVQNIPAVKQNIAPFNPTNPEVIRAELLNRLNASVEGVNAQIESMQQFTGIRFGVHEESGRFFAVIRDSQTGKPLKQIPAEAFLDIAARLKESSGLLVDIMG